jgi:hypothetical protein
VTSLPNTTNRLKPKALQLYQQSRPQHKCNAMPKRKAEEPFSWLPMQVKKPRWPRFEEDWTEDDLRTAMNINALSLEPTKTMEARVSVTRAVKCSVLIQALDLVGFNDVPIDTSTAWEPLEPEPEPFSIVAVGHFWVRRPRRVNFLCESNLAQLG